MGSFPSWVLSWWGVILAGNCPGGEFSLLGVVLVGSCPSWELFWWGVILAGNYCPGGKLS